MDMAENTENSPPAHILPVISHIGNIPLKYCNNSSGNLMNVTHFSAFIELSRKCHLIRSDLMRKLSLKAEMVNLCQFEVVMSVSTCIAWHPKMQAQPMHTRTQSVAKRIIKYACDWDIVEIRTSLESINVVLVKKCALYIRSSSYLLFPLSGTFVVCDIYQVEVWKYDVSNANIERIRLLDCLNKVIRRETNTEMLLAKTLSTIFCMLQCWKWSQPNSNRT